MQEEQRKRRIPWSTPELQRIEAGSAENTTNKGANDDGGAPSQDKS